MIPFISRMPSRSDEVGNLMRRFLGDDLATDFLPQPVSWMPAVEVTENDKEIAITAELPGLSEKEVEVDVDDDVITIRGEKVEEKREEKDRRYHVVERTYGTFRRSFTLPSNIDAQHTHAEFRNGVLTVRLPKTEEEKPRGRKIPIVTRKIARVARRGPEQTSAEPVHCVNRYGRLVRVGVPQSKSRSLRSRSSKSRGARACEHHWCEEPSAVALEGYC
jgi:HSP20 family protein